MHDYWFYVRSNYWPDYLLVLGGFSSDISVLSLVREVCYAISAAVSL